MALTSSRPAPATPRQGEGEGCTRCRAIRKFGRSGPFTPAEFMALADLVEPTPDPITLAVKQDPRVVEALAEFDRINGLYPAVYDAWLKAASAHHTASLTRPNADKDRKVKRLARDMEKAQERLDLVHKALVETRGLHQAAQVTARRELLAAQQPPVSLASIIDLTDLDA
ncbi:hypothetical protein GCM10022221_18160 [Actinocorallia aurea]